MAFMRVASPMNRKDIALGFHYKVIAVAQMYRTGASKPAPSLSYIAIEFEKQLLKSRGLQNRFGKSVVFKVPVLNFARSARKAKKVWGVCQNPHLAIIKYHKEFTRYIAHYYFL